MSKVNSYNQGLLAVIGTIALIFTLIGGSLTLYFLYEEFSYEYEASDLRMVSNEEVMELSQDSLRKHLISMSKIQLIDTVHKTYVIPVSQANLEDEEGINNDFLGLTNTYRSSKENYYSGRAYSNLIVYEEQSEQAWEVYQSRICINEYGTLATSEGLVLRMTVSKEDTNKDGFIDNRDLTALSLYRLKDKKLIEIASPNRDYLYASRLYDTNYLVVRYGVDRNQNGEFDSGMEPTFLYKLDLTTGQMEMLLEEKLLERLQKRLDGRE